jgi:hypothetical protein
MRPGLGAPFLTEPVFAASPLFLESRSGGFESFTYVHFNLVYSHSDLVVHNHKFITVTATVS